MPYGTWKRYEFEGRWTSYFTQVDQVLRFQPLTCLEIGVGNGIVTDALKRQGIAVTTLDIDAALQPDVVGSVENIPLADSSIDIALCAEVLEHLPFDRFEICIRELMRVVRKGVILSLPHWGYTLRVVADVPGFPEIRWAWKLPIARPITSGGVHFWEIGRQAYPLTRIKNIVCAHAIIERDWLSPWMPYHHFFRLIKRSV